MKRQKLRGGARRTSFKVATRPDPELLVAGLGALFVLSGITLLLGAPKPAALEAALPAWVVKAWAVSILIGGALLAYGALRDILIVQLGSTLLAIPCLIYGVVLIAFTYHRGGFAAGAITFGFGLLFAGRSRQIGKQMENFEDPRKRMM